MFNSLEMAAETRAVVCRNDARKYYRFRSSRFYGGIATADSVGCCLRCVFCWSWNVTSGPETLSEFYSSEEVARRLAAIAGRRGSDS